MTIAGLVLAVSAIFIDPTTAPWLASLFGDHMAAKIGAIGALMAALGRAVLAKTPPADLPPTDAP